MKTHDKKSGKQAKKRINKDVAKKVRSSKGGKGARAKRAKSELRATFMQSILDKRQELENILEGLMENQKEYDVQFSGGDLIDELDQAQREISARSYYPIIERKIKELKKIDLLIKRMSKEEKFGLCEECGKHIPKERLLIVPEASLCVSCQRQLEKMEIWRGLEVRAYAGTGGGEESAWQDPGDSDANSYMIVRTHTETFSLNDVQGTDPENDFSPPTS